MGRGGNIMRVVFFGTSNYCLPVLEILKKSFDLVQVITRPDRPVGRKQILMASAVKTWAIQNQVPVTTELKPVEADLAIVADFGKIIPPEIFNKPVGGTLNIHFSKLPDLRGPSPVQNTLLRGDTTAWITVFKIDEHMDTGPILWQKSYPIKPDDTTETLYRRLFSEVANELPEILTLDKFSLQPEKGATYTKFITKQDGFVDWEKIKSGGQEVYKQFRAMTPWPGLWSIHPNGKRIIIRNCHLDDGKLVLDDVQFEGKRPEKFNS